MSIVKYNPQEITFNQKDVMPYGKLGSLIDWNKVFKDKIWLFYPAPINWNGSVDEQWEFNAEKFYAVRLWYEEKRKRYLEEIKHTMTLLERIQTREDDHDMYEYYILEYLKKIPEMFEKMFFLWEKEKWVYEQAFYKNLKSLEEQIKEKKSLTEKNDKQSIFTEITENVNECLLRENEERSNFIEKTTTIREDGIKKYVKNDKTLNVDAVLKDLNSHRSRNEEYMLMAFYTAKCSKQDLERLQIWVIEALNSKIKRLDTFKVFILLERVLPFIYQGFKIDWDLPEIFRPEYLNKISIYDLDIDGFIAQVKNNWEKYTWTEEIQKKLIEQFKNFWSSESGAIWFGQWSEQLRYRNWVTSGVNEENFKHYLKSPNLWEEKRPIPNILRTELPDQKEDLLKTLK